MREALGRTGVVNPDPDLDPGADPDLDKGNTGLALSKVRLNIVLVMLRKIADPEWIDLLRAYISTLT